MDIDPSVPIWTIEHVAAALHLRVDTAREYTHLHPRVPGRPRRVSRNLWLRQDVLAWFAGLPAAEPADPGVGPAAPAPPPSCRCPPPAPAEARPPAPQLHKPRSR